jgi:hypothetical protein
MAATNQPTGEALGQFLNAAETPEASWKGQGAIETWAAQFATDSLNQSRLHAYKSVEIVRKRIITSHGRPLTVYDVTRASDYSTVNQEVVKMQLAKGGFRLAELLDQIFAN